MSTLWVRFWSKVEVQPNGCWLWRGAKGKRQRKGFDGRLFAGETTKADGGKRRQNFVSPHRQVLRWAVGNPPTPDHQACHKCPDPTNESTLCCNPSHLYWGTQAQNE